MKKRILILLLIISGIVAAKITSRKATVLTTDGKVLDLTIVQESMDSLTATAFGKTLYLAKSSLKTITYHQDEQPVQIAALPPQPSFEEFKNKICVGIEYDPFRISDDDEGFSSTAGTISYFNLARNTEIAMPFYLSRTNLKYLPTGGHLNIATVDLRYRYYFLFLNHQQIGGYVSAGMRYAHLQGTLGDSYDPESGQTPPASYIYPQGSADKIGLCAGLGFRFFTKAGFYWGASASLGHYFFGENNKFFPDYYEGKYIIVPDEDHDLFIDIELLKFGWAF